MKFIKPQGGIELPTLSNPAAANEIINGKEVIGAGGGKIVGSHVCAAGLDTSDATAAAADVLSGKTAYAKGAKVTGNHTCPTVGALTSDANAAAGDIVSPKTAYVSGKKLTGTHVCKTLAEMTNDADAAAGDIASGKTAYVNGEKVTGSYVAPAPGYQYEEVTKAAVNGASATYTVTTSLNSITSYRGAAVAGWSMSTGEPIVGVSPDFLCKASWNGGYGVNVVWYNTNTTFTTSGGTLAIRTGSAQMYTKLNFLFVGN